mmetsp:Transcript_53858/g.143091  ORF Transcript_53858/g.143091 Transcript_53858/m.143091 type:complete len:100 (-) Transcript_53858:91-390(-)|eukprot:3457270-Prymnesium_polylepis.3
MLWFACWTAKPLGRRPCTGGLLARMDRLLRQRGWLVRRSFMQLPPAAVLVSLSGALRYGLTRQNVDVAHLCGASHAMSGAVGLRCVSVRWMLNVCVRSR